MDEIGFRRRCYDGRDNGGSYEGVIMMDAITGTPTNVLY